MIPLLRAGFAASFSFADMYMQAWAQLRLDGSLIPHLTEDDLRDDLGMRSAIHRKAVLRAIAEQVAVAAAEGASSGAGGGAPAGAE